MGHTTIDIVYSDTIEVTEDNETKLITITSNHLDIESDINKTILTKPRNELTRQNTCSSSVHSMLYNDLYRARGNAQKSFQLLQSAGYNHNLYKKLFGAGTSGRLHQVYTNFINIYNATFQNVQFRCLPNSHESCSRGSFAFVYPNSPYSINLCSRYFDLSPSPRASTIVHELSHFVNVADTDDFDESDEFLAQHYPHLAIRNARAYSKYSTLSGSGGGGGGGSTPAVNYEFNSNQNAQGWSYRNMIQQYYGPYGGGWFFACNRSDPQLLSPNLNLNASGIQKVQISIANQNPSAYSWLQVFWKTNAEPYFSESKSKYVQISNHGGWSTYSINMQHSKWQGTIKQIRIDPITQGNGPWIGIDYIRFKP